MAKIESLYSIDLSSESRFSSARKPDARGMGYLIQLKQILEADQGNIIKEADVESFLQSFQGDIDRLKKFHESLYKFQTVMQGKIFIEIEKIQGKIASKAENQYSCTQLAGILGVDRKSVINWVTAGYFPNIVHRGKKNMIIESDITKFVNAEGFRYLKLWQRHLGY
jgi:hypothetical protein